MGTTFSNEECDNEVDLRAFVWSFQLSESDLR